MSGCAYVFEQDCVCCRPNLDKYVTVSYNSRYSGDLYVTEVWLPVTLNGQFLHLLFEFYCEFVICLFLLPFD